MLVRPGMSWRMVAVRSCRPCRRRASACRSGRRDRRSPRWERCLADAETRRTRRCRRDCGSRDFAAAVAIEEVAHRHADDALVDGRLRFLVGLEDAAAGERRAAATAMAAARRAAVGNSGIKAFSIEDVERYRRTPRAVAPVARRAARGPGVVWHPRAAMAASENEGACAARPLSPEARLRAHARAGRGAGAAEPAKRARRRRSSSSRSTGRAGCTTTSASSSTACC